MLMAMSIDLRKMAAEIVGRDALDARFGPPSLSTLDQMLLLKAASADLELLQVAATLGAGRTMQAYEKLGGKYSEKG